MNGLTQNKSHMRLVGAAAILGPFLLVQGAKENITALKHEDHLLVLDATWDLPHTVKAANKTSVSTVCNNDVIKGNPTKASNTPDGTLPAMGTGCTKTFVTRRARSSSTGRSSSWSS